MHEKDALAAHLRDELGQHPTPKRDLCKLQLLQQQASLWEVSFHFWELLPLLLGRKRGASSFLLWLDSLELE